MMRLPIARKLPAAIIGIGLLVGAGVGASGYLIASRTAEELTFARLDGLAADRSDLLRSYLSSRELSVLTAARSETVQNALRDLHFGWMKMGDTPGQQLFDAYVTKNPNPEGERAKLADAGSGNNYDSAHVRVHPALQVLAQSAGFLDIYLFDNDGNALYTVNKGQDFAGGFGSGGTFADTALGHIIGQLKDDQQSVTLSDIGRLCTRWKQADRIHGCTGARQARRAGGQHRGPAPDRRSGHADQPPRRTGRNRRSHHRRRGPSAAHPVRRSHRRPDVLKTKVR